MLFHPSDFTAGSEVAFAHALKLSLEARDDLKLLHVEQDRTEVHWADFPGVRAMLERWGVLPEGSSRGDVTEAGLRVEKIVMLHPDALSSILHFLEKQPADLIVLSTHQRKGAFRWLEKAVAEPIARQSTSSTLFVPHDSRGFVSVRDGSLSLSNILVPVCSYPHPQPAIDAAEDLVRVLGIPGVSVRAIYVGSEPEAPTITISMPPEAEDPLHLETRVVNGNVVDRIIQTAEDWPADLIVMSTAGHHGFLDAFRGSTTEQVLRRARCPVLAVPHTGARRMTARRVS